MLMFSKKICFLNYCEESVFTGQNSQYKIDWSKSKSSCDEFKHQTVRLLTLHVLQLLDVSDCVSGVDVAPVAVTEMPQDVFGVKG